MSNLDIGFVKPVTSVFEKTWTSPKKVVINQGGSRSSKTFSICQCCLLHAVLNPMWTITIVGQDIPFLKQGPIRDMERIIGENPHFKKYIKGEYSRSERLYRFYNGSIIEFKSYDNAQDAHSGSRHVLFVNECYGVNYAIYSQLAMRTSHKIYLDFNPSAEFWAHNEVWMPAITDELGQPILEDGKEVRKIADDVVLYISSWRNNPYVDPSIVKYIEGLRMKDPEAYKVYGLGRLGSIEGLVYKRVDTIAEWPKEVLDHAKIVYGIDYGYSNDPTAMVKVAIWKNCLYLDEIIYAPRLKINDMAELIKKKIGNAPVWSEIDPRLVDELRLRHVNIRQVLKNDKDILPGISLIQSFEKIIVTQRSLKVRKELQNYKYEKNKNNDQEIMPKDLWNHAMDAMRYAVMSEKRIGAFKVWTIPTRDVVYPLPEITPNYSN